MMGCFFYFGPLLTFTDHWIIPGTLMKKPLVFLYCFLFLFSGAFCQNIPSPGSFLGYSPGSRFTRYARIADYFRTVAQAAPDRVKLEQYGETYEGRPLLLAYIASPGNLRRLDAIRLNNLRLAGIVHDGTPPDEQAPAIVWLSYNVHGNEPSSSEAAMRVLFTLLDPAEPKNKEWLAHTIVIIDPCLNPDGRERYVNWYTMVQGKNPNPDPQSREHNEPWPGGRSNHYNFDLNRDWAWQTQIETQQRMKRYNAWLPQVHVDFHEQGIDNPYYFAPAAEPYHDVITPWQRQFQVMIGKNNAKYFDRRGWLYFTKEEFDLFYPSYGDTYPLYNGAIGMTFEQAGNSGGGSSVITADEDTLTLADRVEHHFTASLSTIETAAQHAAELVTEFRKYFSDARTGAAGEFRAWVVKGDRYGNKLDRLKTLLDRNGITWIPLMGSGELTGLDYQTGKMAPFRFGYGDILIKSAQPKSNLLRVLFERNSHITDSVTYDITAWSLPFAFGLQTYGLTTLVDPSGHDFPIMSQMAIIRPDNRSAYAFVCRWTGWQSARFLAQLLQNGIKVRFAEQAFQAGGLEFDRGSLIIVTGDTAAGGRPDTLLTGMANRAGVIVWPVASGFVEKGADFGSSHVRLIHKPRVALLTGQQVNSLNAGEVWHFFEQELDYPVSLINAEDAVNTDWRKYDVLILPDGEYKFPEEKNVTDMLKDWVKQGGRLIVMGNAVAQLAKGSWGIRQKSADADSDEDDKDKKEADYSDLRRYADRERHEVTGNVPGAIYRIELDNSHPLAFGYPDHYYSLKQDDRVYEFIKDSGWNVGVIKKENYVSGFTGSKAKEKLKDGLIFGVQEMGKGKIVYMADDPLFRDFWENGKQLFCNAVFLVGQ
jgi:Zinc carboxypeptidase